MPIIPTSMDLEYAYQYSVTSIEVLENSTSTEAGVLTDNAWYSFSDNDSNGVVSVGVFRNSKNETVLVQIPDDQYYAMGQKNGIVYNPTKNEFLSAYDLIKN